MNNLADERPVDLLDFGMEPPMFGERRRMTTAKSVQVKLDSIAFERYKDVAVRDVPEIDP